MFSSKTIFGLALVSLLCTACGHRRQAVYVPATPACCTAARAPEAAVSPRYTEVGIASWYGKPYDGRRAANGEIYDMNKLTAAHLTLPFGTQVKVTDLENQLTVSVRITDRGPFVKGRILDLSLAAARSIQMLGPGTAKVRLEVESAPAAPVFGEFAVQVGAFRDTATADRVLGEMAQRYGSSFEQRFDSSNGVVYRVRVGPKLDLARAQELSRQMTLDGLQAFVVRIDSQTQTYGN